MATAARALGRAARAAAPGAGPARGFSVLTATEEFPGVPSTCPTPKKGSVSSVTTLPSGLTVVTEDASLVSTVALTYPRAGSGSEGPAEAGAALANRYLAFKSGSGLSSALILRSLEDVGATAFARAGRRGATLGFTAAREHAAYAAPLLATACAFEKWDVAAARDGARAEATEAAGNAQNALTDQIYAAAYGAQSALGRPYHTPGASRDALVAFRQRAYVLDGAVLAATGVTDHAAFVRAVEDEFPAPAPGAAAGAAGDAEATADALAAAVDAPPSAEVVEEAKAAARAEALAALDAGSTGLADAMTASILDSGGFSAAAVAESYDAITAQDVGDAHDVMLKSKVSLAAVGDIASVPYHGTIAARFG